MHNDLRITLKSFSIKGIIPSSIITQNAVKRVGRILDNRNFIDSQPFVPLLQHCLNYEVCIV